MVAFFSTSVKWMTVKERRTEATALLHYQHPKCTSHTFVGRVTGAGNTQFGRSGGLFPPLFH